MENSQPVSKAKISFTTQDIVLTGMFAAVLAVISQISLPMPTGVPITIQVFGVALVGAVLGWKLGFVTTVVYILLGAVGLPVFANFHGGISALTGMAGGYILAWPALALSSSIRPKTANQKINFIISVILSIVGLLIVEFIGGLQWALLAGEQSYGAIMAYSFVAFIPKDIVITVLAIIIGSQIRKPLMKAGYIKA